MSTEEELNISGPEKQTAPSNGPTSTNKIIPHIADLTGLNGPGDGAEEFLDRLLSIPAEQMIPWEECTLPSNGLYYGWPDGTVRVKAMGTVAEKVLATQRLAQTGESIDYLFRECCRFPDGFDPVDLLLGDRIFMLYYLRGITHGNIYEFAITCPNETCKSVSMHQYDLNDLAETITWADRSLGLEPFKIVLPYLSKATGREVFVGVRFLRAVDANEMLAKRKARKKALAKPGGVRNRITAQRQRETRNQSQAQSLDDTINDNMEKIIVSVMGVRDPFKVRDFVAKLHSQDTAIIREWLREHTPGIDNTIEVDCPDCGNNFVIELPITESFFRPAKLARV